MFTLHCPMRVRVGHSARRSVIVVGAAAGVRCVGCVGYFQDSDEMPTSAGGTGGLNPNQPPSPTPVELSRQVSTKTYDEAFYRHHLGLGPGCEYGQCAQNRLNDPFCLCKLEAVLPSEGDRPKRQGRKAIPAGLRNLGQTCYMNSYLQTLFHILPVRRILYEWRQPADQVKDERKQYHVAEELRHLFGRLQCGQESAVSPRRLVAAIGVDATMQQDAQEFSTLFMEWIDEVMAEQPKEEKLRSLFAGKYRSAIRCRSCQAESPTEFDFSDLSLQVNDFKDLNGCLDQYFSVEEVDTYACEKCPARGAADKKIQLLKLPRFLNVHLCRYLYDKELMRRIKLTHAVTFPMILDLRPYLTDEQANEWGELGCCYELIAVLIHQGSAQEGHYYARIRSGQDRKWCTFDDDDVSPYEFAEGNETDARGAYMLVYEKLIDVETQPQVPDVPCHVAITENLPYATGRQLRLKQSLERVNVDRFLRTLKPQKGASMIWLPTEWLARVARAVDTGVIESVVDSPDLTANVCSHGLLGNVNGLKVVNRGHAQRLLYGLEAISKPQELRGSMFCSQCTRLADTPTKPRTNPERKRG